MKIKHSKAIRAYMAIANMSNDEIPLSISYKLFKVKKMLQPQWDFQNERIKSVMDKCGALMQPDGSVKFKNKKDGEKCANDLNKMLDEIGEIEVDFADAKKPIIRLDTNINLSIDDIDALTDFIDFEE